MSCIISSYEKRCFVEYPTKLYSVLVWWWSAFDSDKG